MSGLSKHVTTEFCNLCNWTYQVWFNHRILFHDKNLESKICLSKGSDFFKRLSVISQEYALLQLIKLHDPCIVSGKITLGIDYVLKYGGWDTATFSALSALGESLNDFAKNFKTVRNKVLAHNDLAAILSGDLLGEFERDVDLKYFNALQEFVTIIHFKVVGEPYLFEDLVQNDVTAFIDMLKLQDTA